MNTLTQKTVKRFPLVGQEDELHTLKMAVEHNLPALLIGDTGTGKSYIVQSLAEDTGADVMRVNLNGDVGINELLGKWLIKDGNTYWQDGVLTSAMKRGAWLILDEINAALPEILLCLNQLLDDGRAILLAEKDNEVIRPADSFRLFACMNPSGDYAGTKELNLSLLSRFAVVLFVDYQAPEAERKILEAHTGIQTEPASVMIDTANTIRKLRRERASNFVCSTRDLVSWARLFMAGLTLEKAFVLAVLNKASEDDRKNLAEAVLRTACKISIEPGSFTKDTASLTDTLAKEHLKLKKAIAKMRKLTDTMIPEVLKDLVLIAEQSKAEDESNE